MLKNQPQKHARSTRGARQKRTENVCSLLQNCSKIVPKMFKDRLQNCSKIVPNMLKNRPRNCSKMGPKRLLEGSWRGQKSVRAAVRLLERSWGALGGLSGRKKVLREGLRRLLRKFQERFQRPWGPKGSQKGAQNEPKTGSEIDSS